MSETKKSKKYDKRDYSNGIYNKNYEDIMSKGFQPKELVKWSNNVIDEYTMFNNYFDFIIMRFSDKPLLIVFGSMKRMAENFNQITSIKFYNASYFIEKRTERYPVKQEVNDVNENYKFEIDKSLTETIKNNKICIDFILYV